MSVRNECVTNVQHLPRSGKPRSDGLGLYAPCVAAGYSGTPLPRKLGIKDDADVALVSAPDEFERLLDPLPDGAVLRRRLVRKQDVIVFFTTKQSELERRFARLVGVLASNGGLWVAWPKRASGVATDLNENLVRDVGLAHGLVDNKVCAIDDTWSGLRFVRRLGDR
jgi:hypothetical protein